jgi:3-hydroxybutyryl-CoA dehydrogenase
MNEKSIGTVACLGTGTMGHGVAFLAAKAGNRVRMFGRSGESIRRGLDGIDRAVRLYEDNGLLPMGRASALKANITGVTDIGEAVSGADLVMESVAEDLEIKHAVYRLVEKFCPQDAVLATDTSGLAPSEIAGALAKPERFCAIHFINPPYLMPTVEICPCPETSPWVIRTAAAWVEAMGNVPLVLSREVPGFIINRIQSACVREALYIVEQGWASPETVDKAVSYSLGRRYSTTGPLESADMGGLDVFDPLLDELGDKLYAGNSPRLIKDLVRQGRLGLKSGRGIYEWSGERIQERRGRREKSLIAFLRRDQAEKEGKQ